ncbi:MAG: hypothetical protein OK454_09360 [Thaumarchaeota archaeon]|nr:hypothetical protein [Nitrososphaerota archaeon]
MAINVGGTRHLGILAYGPLTASPGPEIASVTVERIKNVETPFKVEFARKSKTRGHAPTLIPVGTGGARVRAEIMVIRDGFAEDLAADMLWRRETHQTGRQKYRRPDVIDPNHVTVETVHDLSGVKTVLYTKIGQNIDPLSAKTLAELAVNSVRSAPRGTDGITYLMDAKKIGIETPLMKDYESEILQRTRANTLGSALNQLRSRNA